MDEQLAQLIRALSTLLGWIYTLSWSASFYPQPILNWKRKSTQGTTVDFPALNVLGFISYTISTSCFLYSPVIQRQYAERHPAAPTPTVRFNDFAFGAHATVMVILTYSQFYPSIWGFKVTRIQRMSTPVAIIVTTSIAVILTASLTVFIRHGFDNGDPKDWNWIDVIYIFGHIKLLATFVKYIPQAWMNYKRKSTTGWSIWQILMDITGGVLSLTQLIIDSSFQGDWSGITGNPVKLGLANISIGFDIIFIIQHFVLYKDESETKMNDDSQDVQTPLLS